VAILIPKLSNALFVDLLDAAQQTLRAAGFQTLIGVTDYDEVQEEQLLREHLLHRPAGMLITGLNHNAPTQALIESSRVPCVHLMDLPPADDTSTHCVGLRQDKAGLALTPDVDAIFFCNDDLAQGALLAALRSQIPVPQRVAIAGFNDLTGSDQMLPPLTTVRTPRAAIGREGAEMLLRLMQGQEQSPAWLDLGFEVVVRGSS
jgi:LacI family gluconate utilization system Gnt-I transcriptional repressor